MLLSIVSHTARQKRYFKQTIYWLFSLFFLFNSANTLADEIENLISHWRTQNYQTVLPLLIEYRLGPYGKNLQVDYMIATTLCRLPDKAELGRKFFQRILAAYELSKNNRQQINRERERCNTELSTDVFPTLVSFSLGHSDVGVKGKTFYWLDQRNSPLGGAPIKMIRDIPKDKLNARLFLPEQKTPAIKHIKKILGEDTIVKSSEHFLVASSKNERSSATDLTRIAQTLDRVMQFYHQEFELPLPKYLITVYLAPHPYAFQKLANKLHGIRLSGGSIGYSFRDDYSISGVISGANSGTLKHELFHLMVRNDFGDIPPWLDEGLSSLYEVSRFEDNKIQGLRNWRGDILRRFWSKRPTVNELIQMDWAAFDATGKGREKQAVIHATARYFILYLQSTGELSKVYKAFQEQPIEELSGDSKMDSGNLLSKTLGRSLDKLDQEFVNWFEGFGGLLNTNKIKNIQQQLNQLGFHAGKPDGLIGPKTREAISDFQVSKGLKVNGNLNTKTLKALNDSAKSL